MVMLVNCSLREEKSNSSYFLRLLEKQLSLSCGRIGIMQIVGQTLTQADALVLAMPLYVDGVPGQVLERMEELYDGWAGQLGGLPVYVVMNLGFYEAEQAQTALAIIENWCRRMGFTYGGGIAIGAGEMLGRLQDVPSDQGPNWQMGEGIKDLAACIENASVMDNLYVGPAGFPRKLYQFMADQSWRSQAKQNKLTKKDLLQCREDFLI